MVTEQTDKSEKSEASQDVFKNVTYYIVGDVSEEVSALHALKRSVIFRSLHCLQEELPNLDAGELFAFRFYEGSIDRWTI